MANNNRTSLSSQPPAGPSREARRQAYISASPGPMLQESPKIVVIDDSATESDSDDGDIGSTPYPQNQQALPEHELRLLDGRVYPLPCMREMEIEAELKKGTFVLGLHELKPRISLIQLGNKQPRKQPRKNKVCLK